MKFVTLALAVFLTVGCQAASDPPSFLEKAGAIVGVRLSQFKDGLLMAIDHLDDAEFKEEKDLLSKGVNNVASHVAVLQQNAEPYTNAFMAQFLEMTKPLSASFETDYETLHTQLESNREHLTEVVNRHMEDYRRQLEPMMREYHEKQTQQMAELKAKYEHMLTELRAKIETNVRETQAALAPIANAVHTRIGEHVQNLMELIKPYVDEYREQARKSYEHAQTIDHTNIVEKLKHLVMTVRGWFTNIVERARNFFGL